ncbi:primase-helicase family protein [Bradyrhizobium erythrophlei]|uniref:primase-helicase family protein n=1 Tax=Bradyrhizobium erythrophlei TaxID=1437360 RepID=UPI00115FAF06|nr:primase-helicase family protein [Bradyrhizobium erythrophlei]
MDRISVEHPAIANLRTALFASHYFQVDDARYITGQFNAHMASCLLLQANEAVWAGDKTAECRLKGLITSEVQIIESKGVDPIRLRNFVRAIMSSNEGWVVPAGMDERRFVVLDVNPRGAQNRT